MLEEAYAGKREAMMRAHYLAEQIAAEAFEFVAAPKNLIRPGKRSKGGLPR